MITRSSGFTLIELLVVVAIIGILGAIGVVTYSGYVSATERKSAENVMRQVSLGQTEYYSENGIYLTTDSGTSCSPNIAKSEEIEDELLGGASVIVDSTKSPKKANANYLFCVSEQNSTTPKKFQVIAVEQASSNVCTLTLTADGTLTRSGC